MKTLARILTSLLLGVLVSVNTAPAQSKYIDSSAIPDLPTPLTTFGSAVHENHLYVFGGLLTNQETKDGCNNRFYRIDLSRDGSAWEELPIQRPAIGAKLIAHGSHLYRIGGLNYSHQSSGEIVFESYKDFARFDPAGKSWETLTEMPTGRASFDACLIENEIFVVGGWDRTGISDRQAVWASSLIKYDLTKPGSQWKVMAQPPFAGLRAMSVAAYQNKIYVLGGLDRSGLISKSVFIYDVAANQWTHGPDLVNDSALSGIGTAAASNGRNLLYSGSEGHLYQLSDDSAQWVKQDQLWYSRTFHQLAFTPDQYLIAMGGSHEGRVLASIERTDINRHERKLPKVIRWSQDYSGNAIRGQAIATDSRSFAVLGGLEGVDQTGSTSNNPLKEAYLFDVMNRSVERLADLPEPTAFAAARLSTTSDVETIDLIGGATTNEIGRQTRSSILQYSANSKKWIADFVKLPSPRSHFGIVEKDESLWIFGGQLLSGAGRSLAKETWHWFGDSDDSVTEVASARWLNPRHSFGCATINNRLYVIGGLEDDSKIARNVDVFDFDSRTWHTITGPEHPRISPDVAVLGDRLYLSGGDLAAGNFDDLRSTLMMFEPITQKWSVVIPKADFVRGRMIRFSRYLLFFNTNRGEKKAEFALFEPYAERESRFSQPSEMKQSGQVELFRQLIRMDKNLDGLVSDDEVSQRMQSLLRRADKNGDGHASYAELRSLLTQ